eukprot:84766_1
MAKTKNELMAMSNSQLKDYLTNNNIDFHTTARAVMIHLILMAKQPHVPTQASDDDLADQSMHSVSTESTVSDETSISSVTPHDTHHDQPKTQQNIQPLLYPSRKRGLEVYEPESFPNSHYNRQSKHPHQKGPNPSHDIQRMANNNGLLTLVPRQTANNNHTMSDRTHTSHSDAKHSNPVLGKYLHINICYFYNHYGCNRPHCAFLHRSYVNVLREYQSLYCLSTDVNAKNIGITLKKVLDVYVKTDHWRNPEYIYKFTTETRAFCDVVTNYVLKEKSIGLNLYQKIRVLARLYYPKFPKQDMDFIRVNMNPRSHGPRYNQLAQNRYIAKKDQKKIIISIYKITKWIKQQMFKQ